MAVKTYAEKKDTTKLPGKTSDKEIEQGKNSKVKAEDKNSHTKVKMTLSSLPNIGKEDYTCYMSKNRDEKPEKLILKKGVLEVKADDVEMYRKMGFVLVEEYENKNTFPTLYNPDYIESSFELPLDDGTKVKIEKGKVKPENDYQYEQLNKRHFVIHSL